MQQMLQQLFDRECRNYAFYMQKLKVIERQYDEFTKRREKICEYEESCKKVNEMARLLESEEFLRVKDKLDLPENFNTFEKTFSNYKLDKDYTEELKFISKEQEFLNSLMLILKGNLKKSRQTFFYYITTASDNKVKFSFLKDNKIAREIFILYYRDRVEFDYRRNVINIKGCKLNEEFMNAYKAEENEDAEAYDWFATKAEEYRRI